MKISNRDDIIKYFENGCKTKKLIGVENEKFLYDKKTNKRATYFQVKKVLDHIKLSGWQEIKEHRNLIGLRKDGKFITLEPGNQIELAGDTCKNIHEVCSESYIFQKQLDEACLKSNLRTLSIGFDPISKLEEVPNNPKERYKIMKKEMPKGGKLSLNMMYQTCGTQINMDYSSEEDFKQKFKVVSYLTPLAIGLFANSAIRENKPSGFLSYRSKVWQNTSRGGLPDIFLEDMTFEKYADFVINYPLLFIYENNSYRNPQKKKYFHLMEKNLANLENLKFHLSTIFTELRLKSYIEIRSLDTCEWNCHCAGPAFFTGLVYGNLEETLDLIKGWSKDDVMNAYKQSNLKGLKTEIAGKTIQYWSEVILNISKKGLKKRHQLNQKGNDERIYLKNIDNILFNKNTRAEETLLYFKNEKNNRNSI